MAKLNPPATHARRSSKATHLARERGQAAILLVVALMAVFMVVPTVAVSQALIEAPPMIHVDLLANARVAAQSGLQLFEAAVDQDPLALRDFPSPQGTIEPKQECETSTSQAGWQVISTGSSLTTHPEEEVRVAAAITLPQGVSTGVVTVFAEGRSGIPGHWTCDEEKMRIDVTGPVLNGPAPGHWASYPLPPWAKYAYASLAGAEGEGCNLVNKAVTPSPCAYSYNHELPTAGKGAEFFTALPLPGPGLIGIGVGAHLPTNQSIPTGQDPAHDPGVFGHGGESGWTPPEDSGFVGWLANKLGGQDPTASFPGGGATIVLWCPAPKTPTNATCDPTTPGAQVLAVAGGGGGSGSDGTSLSLLKSTIYPGGNGGNGGVNFKGALPAAGNWTTCYSQGGCSAQGEPGGSGGGISLIGLRLLSGGAGGSGGATEAGPLASSLDGQPATPVAKACNINISLFDLNFGNASIPYSGGGGGGGYQGGIQGAPGQKGFLNLFCDAISGSGGGGGGSSYIEKGARLMVMNSSNSARELAKANPNTQGFAQLWLSSTPPALSSPAHSSCTLPHQLLAPHPRAQDVAVLLEGQSGYSNSDATGGAGAAFPVLIQLPPDSYLVGSCEKGGSGGDGTTPTPAPSGNGGAGMALCDGRSLAQCSPSNNLLAVAGGGGGAGDQGDAGASVEACAFGACLNGNIGPVMTFFHAGQGGNAGIPAGPPGLDTSYSTSNSQDTYPSLQAGGSGSSGNVSATNSGQLCLPSFFSFSGPCFSISVSTQPGGAGGSSSSGSDPQLGASASQASGCDVFEYAGPSYELDSGGGGGGGGYGGGQAGTSGTTSCSSGGGFVNFFGKNGLAWIYGWGIPGGGGGGGSSWEGGALASGIGWWNPAPTPGQVPPGQTSNSPGGAVVLGSWPAETLIGLSVIASAPVGSTSWASGSTSSS